MKKITFISLLIFILFLNISCVGELGVIVKAEYESLSKYKKILDEKNLLGIGQFKSPQLNYISTYGFKPANYKVNETDNARLKQGGGKIELYLDDNGAFYETPPEAQNNYVAVMLDKISGMEFKVEVLLCVNNRVFHLQKGNKTKIYISYDDNLKMYLIQFTCILVDKDQKDGRIPERPILEGFAVAKVNLEGPKTTIKEVKNSKNVKK